MSALWRYLFPNLRGAGAVLNGMLGAAAAAVSAVVSPQFGEFADPPRSRRLLVCKFAGAKPHAENTGIKRIANAIGLNMALKVAEASRRLKKIFRRRG